MKKLKSVVYRLLMNTKPGRLILNNNFKNKYNSSAGYWEKRYKKGGTSGSGSYGSNAIYKAEILNAFVKENNISRIIEFGCGDGNQLKYFQFLLYTGIDVSETAVQKCKEEFKEDRAKYFFSTQSEALPDHIIKFRADLSLSLDVIYHLVEDPIFEKYIKQLFSSSEKYVIIYAWDLDSAKKFHVRHRNFTSWIEMNIKGWRIKQKIKTEVDGLCDFFIYEKYS